MKSREIESKNGPSIFYKVECDCGGEDDILTFELEFDKDFGDITLHHYCKMQWADYWGFPNFFQKYWRRIKCAFKVLFTGYIEVDHEMIIYGEPHVQSIIDAYIEGKQKVKNWMVSEGLRKETITRL